jgi:hypothetical protein
MKTLILYGREFEIHSVTGKVVGQGKFVTTGISGGGQRTKDSKVDQVRSSTSIHNDIFLQGRDGKEHHFALTDFNVACREGNELTVLWAIKPGQGSGPYFLVVNRTTSEQFWASDSDLFKAFFRKWYHRSPIVILVVFVLIIWGFAGGWILSIILFVVYFIIILRTGYGRINRLKSSFRFEEYAPA